MEQKKVVFTNLFEGKSIKEIRDILRDQAADLKRSYRDALMPALKAAFQEAQKQCPEFKCVVVRGWTPGFNDGDPCVHCQDCVDPEDQPEEYEQLWEDLQLDPEETSRLPKNVNDAWVVVSDVCEMFEDYFESTYGTNWQLTIEWDGQKIHLSDTEYDCGY